MSQETEPVTTFNDLAGAVTFVDGERKATEEQIAKYRHHVKELTGFYPDQKIGPLEVVAIIRRILNGNSPQAD